MGIFPCSFMHILPILIESTMSIVNFIVDLPYKVAVCIELDGPNGAKLALGFSA